MRLDIRTPIGAMFALLGALLAGYGLWAPDQRSASARDLNVNLVWGLCLIIFGALFLALARRARLREERDALTVGVRSS